MAEEAIVNGEKNGCPVTGVIVEPIQVCCGLVTYFRCVLFLERPRVETTTGLTSGSRVFRLFARSTTLSTSWMRSRPAGDRRESKL